MKPIYFPFTYIPTPVAHIVHSCLGQAIVYQPSLRKLPEEMEEHEKEGLIDIRVPIKKDQEKLDAVLKDYAVWADLHGGDKTSLIRFQDSMRANVEHSSISQLRNEIKRHGKDNLSDQKPDYLLNARLFLHFAQEFDIRNNGIDQDISLVAEMEQQLMDNLQGGIGFINEKDPGISMTSTKDHGIHMPAERLNAWICLFLNQTQQEKDESSGIFITTSKAVFELLTENGADAELIVDMPLMLIPGSLDDKLLSWQDSLLKRLSKIVISSWPVKVSELNIPFEGGEKGNTFSLKICIVPNQNPVDFFSKFCNIGSCKAGMENQQTGYRNTLIGLIEG